MKPSWTEVASLIALLLFAVVMAHGWPELSGDFWVALGAIGSLSAAIVGATLGAGSWMRQEKRDNEIATSMGWMIIPWLESVVIGASLAQTALGHLLEPDGTQEPTEVTKYEVALAIELLDVSHLLPFFTHIHKIEAKYPGISKAISESWRLHDNLSNLELTQSFLRPRRDWIGGLRNAATNLFDLSFSIVDVAEKRSTHFTSPPT